ncbi:helix-turn-helix transcriptional regulator [Streptomyces sp. WAC08241]|uniref:ArsR/SmtB family transcription factor n=1 Tax=Streptomyces sp. WAC08241 TaxID=2487421 RepID=UPI000F7A54F0|nr:winged helix-turn-helix domain-containing protein [Streptomyces sp. WAC08241]RSS42595.1 ArsR family transcriptional regulator [Streptomyces sp. WAC08241]
MRFCVSPMWQVGTSFRLLRSGVAGPPYRRWLDQVRPRVTAAGLDRGWLSDLIPAAARYVPDFLNPTPPGPAPTLAEELAAVAATGPERVREDLEHLRHHEGGLTDRLRTLHADPRRGLERLVEEIEAYWEPALAPYWSRVRALLDADVRHRARQAAEHGAGYLFNVLHPLASWHDDVLRLVHRRPRTFTRAAAGSGLLVPCAFKGPGLSTRTVPSEPPRLAYRARGTGTLWEPRPATGTTALAAVLGRTRTLLLAELDAPATTTELAARTGASMAAVSQNLTALRDAGLVTAHRTGRTVLYARTETAQALLTPPVPAS